MATSEYGVIYDFHGVLATRNRQNAFQRINLWLHHQPYYNLKLRAGAENFISALAKQNILQSIATAADADTIFHWYKILNLGKWIPESRVVYADETIRNKAALYKLAAQAMNLQPDQCVLFEDDVAQMHVAFEAGFNRIIGVAAEYEATRNFIVPGLIKWIHDFTEISTAELIHGPSQTFDNQSEQIIKNLNKSI